MIADPQVFVLVVGEYEVCTYLIIDPHTGDAAVIDPAGEEKKVAALARQHSADVKYILCTHGHPDHTLGAARLKELLGAPLAMHEADDDFFASPEGREMAMAELGMPAPPRADIRLKSGQSIALGGLEIRVLHTPGHTPGSVCFLVGKNLFTGDTLFVGDVGRTDLTGGSLDELLASIERELLPLPGDTIVHPGHDYGDTPTSTLEREKVENPYITDFILDK